MGQRWYAWIFAVVTIIATGLLLPGVQANGITSAAEVALGTGTIVATPFGDLGMTKLVTAIAVVMALGFIIFGGVKRIANVTQVIVPFMGLAYILAALVVIVMNIGELPRVIGLIMNDAFTPMAGVGAAIGWGVKRGVYSNEAGQGTGPHAAAAAEVQHPAQQGLVQAFSVYVDTLFVCSATAFIILITGAYNVHGETGFLIQNLPAMTEANSPAFTQFAVESVMPGVGKPFVAVALFFFAFTTLLAYYYIAETNVAYLRRFFRFPGEMLFLKILMMASVFYGAVKTILFFMGKPALKALQDYEKQRKAGVTKYTFDPQALGIENADFWESKLK